jgi:hypothetical protein
LPVVGFAVGAGEGGVLVVAGEQGGGLADVIDDITMNALFNLEAKLFIEP